MRVLIGFAAVALSLSGCDWLGRADQDPRTHVAKAREQVTSECASRLTYARLKEYVFDEAARIRNSEPRRLDQLAAYSVVRMEEPDGRLIPPGAGSTGRLRFSLLMRLTLGPSAIRCSFAAHLPH